MPQPTKGARLGGSPAHQRLILANLATSLFQHGRITTTEAKARRLRPYAERLITKAKVGDLHNRREIMKVIRDKEVVHRLCTEIGPFYADRNGGYTRITKTMPRKGDNAPMAVIELIQQKTVTDEANRARRAAGSQQAAATGGAAAATAGSDVTEADATEVDTTAAATAAAEADAAESATEAELAEVQVTEDPERAEAAADRAADAAEAAADAAEEAQEAAPESTEAEEALTSAAEAEVASEKADEVAEEKKESGS